MITFKVKVGELELSLELAKALVNSPKGVQQTIVEALEKALLTTEAPAPLPIPKKNQGCVG